MGFMISTAAMAPSPFDPAPYWSFAKSVWQRCTNVLRFFNDFCPRADADRDVPLIAACFTTL
jgi:hypothetical protein